MKKLTYILLIFLLLISNKLILNAQIKYDDLNQALNNLGIEKKYESLYEDKYQVYLNVFGKYDDPITKDILEFVNDNYEQNKVFFKFNFYDTSIEDNEELLNNVIDYLNAPSPNGTFILMTDSYILSFNDNTKTTLFKSIKEAYRSDYKSRNDILKLVKKKYYKNTNAIMISFISFIVILTGLFIFGAIKNKRSDS